MSEQNQHNGIYTSHHRRKIGKFLVKSWSFQSIKEEIIRWQKSSFISPIFAIHPAFVGVWELESFWILLCAACGLGKCRWKIRLRKTFEFASSELRAKVENSNLSYLGVQSNFPTHSFVVLMSLLCSRQSQIHPRKTPPSPLTSNQSLLMAHFPHIKFDVEFNHILLLHAHVGRRIFLHEKVSRGSNLKMEIRHLKIFSKSSIFIFPMLLIKRRYQISQRIY